MTYNDPTPQGRRGRPDDGGHWGAIGIFIVGLVVVLALITTLFGPTDTQQATNVPASPPPSTQQTTPPPSP